MISKIGADEVSIIHKRLLDDIHSQYASLYSVVVDQIRALSCDSRFLFENTLDPPFPHTILGEADEETLSEIAKAMIRFEEHGHFGCAYRLAIRRHRNYPKSTTPADRSQLDLYRRLFLTQIHEVLESDGIRDHVPKAMLDATTFFNELAGEYSEASTINLFPGDLDCLGRSTLHIAMDWGTPARLLPLNINHQDVLGRTALYMASWAGDEGFVASLLDSGARVDLPTVTGLIPLHAAAMWGYTRTCERLVDHDWVQEPNSESMREFLHSVLLFSMQRCGVIVPR
jgi:hypothetical protein